MSKKSSKNSAGGILAKIIVAVLLIAVGVLFIVRRGDMLGLAFTLLGLALIVYGIIKLIGGDTITGLVLIILGILVIVFGWALASVACIVAGVFLIVYCVYAIIKKQVHGVFGWLNLILTAAVGICLVLGIINASWIFIIIGIAMILYGISFLFS